MKMLFTSGFAAALALSVSTVVQAAPDAAAAQALVKKSDCLKCHAADKDKKGPAFKKTAAKYKGQADAEDKVIKVISTKPKIKLDDGTEEEHKALKSTDAAEIKNVAQWILSL